MSLDQYLLWLGQSPNNLRDHMKHPRRTMQQQHVPEGDQALLLGGDPDEIARRLQQLGMTGVAFIVCGNPTVIVS